MRIFNFSVFKKLFQEILRRRFRAKDGVPTDRGPISEGPVRTLAKMVLTTTITDLRISRPAEVTTENSTTTTTIRTNGTTRTSSPVETIPMTIGRTKVTRDDSKVVTGNSVGIRVILETTIRRTGLIDKIPRAQLVSRTVAQTSRG